MQPQQLFEIFNALALIGWLLLILLPFKKWTNLLVTGVIISMLCLIYAGLIAASFSPGGLSNFGSLQGVQTLFQNPVMLLAGWVHYLAFDLFVGNYIKNNASENGIPHLVIVPCLLFTFLLGPVGLLLYWLVRFIRKSAFAHAKTTQA